MFLNSIHVLNMRSLPDVRLSFRGDEGASRHWTYVLGQNGTGKSSILKAIALTLAGSEALFELIGDPDNWIRLGQDKASIEVEFATQAGEQRSAKLDFVRGQKTVDFVDANIQSLRQVDAALQHSERNYFVVGYGVTRKPATDERHSFQMGSSIFRSSRGRAVATLFSNDATLVSLESWAMDLEYREGPAGTRSIKSALNALLPNVEFSHIDRKSRRVMFQTEDGQLPLSALSDGYQAMASWCGDLLWQITETFSDYKNPLLARGLLLIDELDLHLHPIWQRELVSFIDASLPNVQVVATTHSPLTVHQAGAGELYVLQRDENGLVQAEHYEGAPNRLMLHQLLQSPLFGLNTLDSPQVEGWREEVRELQKRPDGRPLSSAERSKMNKLVKKLDDVPDWQETQPYLARTNEALERIAAVIQNAPRPPTPRKRSKQE